MSDLEIPYFHARPKGGSTAGIVVIHEGSGMTLQLLRFCERLAGEGFAVVAPDLFVGTGGPGATDDFMAQMGAVDLDAMFGDLATCAGVLRSEGAERIGVTGFCMGGRFTWRAALRGDGFDAAVAFYGPDTLDTPRCPTLAFFGKEDNVLDPEHIAAFAAHHPDTFVYEGAGHGFMRDGSDFYVPDAAADAWTRTVDHFRKHLA
jgi:carboxymethylenebutenolidase